MERQEFQKKLEELGRLAEERENRIRAEEVRDFLKDMELTEEQMELVFAYLASRLVTVEGYVPAKREEEEEAQLTPEPFWERKSCWSSASRRKIQETAG